MALAFAEDGLDPVAETGEQILRHEGLHRAGKAASVDADRAALAEQLAADRERKRHALPRRMRGRPDVLQIADRGEPGFVHEREETVKITLAQGVHGNKQVLLIGDGQAEGWELGDDEVWACVGELFSQLPGRPKVVWRTLPIPSGLRNLTVSAIDFSREVIGTDREVRIDVTVANNGEEAATARALTLSVEGRVYTDASLGQLQPGERRTVSFRHRFGATGTHPVTASLDVEDELAADNTFVRIAAVRGAMRVLVVEGAKGRRLAGRPGAFLALALARWERSAIRAEALSHAVLRAEVPFFLHLESEYGDYLEGAIDLLCSDPASTHALVIDYKTGDAGLTLEQIRERHAMQAGYYADVLLRLGYASVECAFVCVELEDASGEPVVVRYSFDSSNIHSLF